MTRHGTDSDRAARQGAALDRHLNDQHPTTVLLLAQHAPGGRADATEAELTDVDDDGLTLKAIVSNGTADLRLALPGGPDGRSRIALLLKQVRAGLRETVPLTSLEEQMAGGGHGRKAPRTASPRPASPPDPDPDRSTTMNSTTRRRLALPALAFAAGPALAACGDDGGTDTAGSGSSSGEHGGGHSGGDKGSKSAEGNAADVGFLTGMKPQHEQAVEMSDLVLAASPPAEVAAIARQIKDAQSPEIEQMDTMLKALGEETDGGEHEGHSAGHGGMMSEGDLAALKAATGTEAARLYLEAMVAHHEGAVEAADTEIAAGKYGPAVALAKEIKTTQQAEITEMQDALKDL